LIDCRELLQVLGLPSRKPLTAPQIDQVADLALHGSATAVQLSILFSTSRSQPEDLLSTGGHGELSWAQHRFGAPCSCTGCYADPSTYYCQKTGFYHWLITLQGYVELSRTT
jgi:hypothetical protein